MYRIIMYSTRGRPLLVPGACGRQVVRRATECRSTGTSRRRVSDPPRLQAYRLLASSLVPRREQTDQDRPVALQYAYYGNMYVCMCSVFSTRTRSEFSFSTELVPKQPVAKSDLSRLIIQQTSRLASLGPCSKPVYCSMIIIANSATWEAKVKSHNLTKGRHHIIGRKHGIISREPRHF